MAGAMLFASLTDAVVVEMGQWRAQRFACIVEKFLKMVTLLLKRSEYYVSISILLFTEKFLAAIP
jgi:hypothetical protein